MDRRILDDAEFRIADREFEDVLFKVRPEELQSKLREKYEAAMRAAARAAINA